MKPPKTADGVEIKPGDTVWFISHRGPYSQKVFVFDYSLDAWSVRLGTYLTPVKYCYSTREALIAASEITDSDIVEFLRHDDICIENNPVDGVNIHHRNFISYGDNYIEAIKKAIIKERERESS